jgi:GTP-binding protein
VSSSTKAPKRIVIVGRPNVGKSTLFNRLIGRRRALVHDEPGVTRDRLEENGEWWVKARKMPITLVDTGGLGGERFADEIAKQVKIALEDADAVLFLFDVRVGVTPADRELLQGFTRSGVKSRVPFIAVVNKVDADKHEADASEFYELGLDPVLTISAEHARGIDDLQEAIARATGFLDEGETDTENQTETENQTDTDTDTASASDEDYVPRIPRIAIVGRPNVGKSTMTNALLGADRMITSPIAGTTVDSIDSHVRLGNHEFILIDTAGIRRKSKTEQGIEVLSVVQARKALERADIAILLLDAETGTIDQDEKIGGLIEEVGASVILCVNKWDTQRGNSDFSREDAAERIREDMGYLRYAPILFVSAKERRGFDKLGDLIAEILHQRRLKIPTHEFTEWVRKQSVIHNPMGAKFYLSHQSGRNPPTFVCHVSDPEKVHFSLRRNLVNAMRERWGFMGSPIRLLFVKGSSTK